MCGCCAKIAGRVAGVAEFRWWTHGGRYFHDLCSSCVGWWLLVAVEDDEVTPFRVALLSDASVRPDGGG